MLWFRGVYYWGVKQERLYKVHLDLVGGVGLLIRCWHYLPIATINSYLFPTQIVSIDNSIKSCVFKVWKKWWSPPHPVPVRTVEGAKSCVFTWPSWPSAIIRCSSTSMDPKVARSDFLGGTPGSIKTLGKSLGNAKKTNENMVSTGREDGKWM